MRDFLIFVGWTLTVVATLLWLGYGELPAIVAGVLAIAIFCGAQRQRE